MFTRVDHNVIEVVFKDKLSKESIDAINKALAPARIGGSNLVENIVVFGSILGPVAVCIILGFALKIDVLVRASELAAFPGLLLIKLLSPSQEKIDHKSAQAFPVLQQHVPAGWRFLFCSKTSVGSLGLYENAWFLEGTGAAHRELMSRMPSNDPFFSSRNSYPLWSMLWRNPAEFPLCLDEILTPDEYVRMLHRISHEIPKPQSLLGWISPWKRIFFYYGLSVGIPLVAVAVLAALLIAIPKWTSAAMAGLFTGFALMMAAGIFLPFIIGHFWIVPMYRYFFGVVETHVQMINADFNGRQVLRTSHALLMQMYSFSIVSGSAKTPCVLDMPIINIHLDAPQVELSDLA